MYGELRVFSGRANPALAEEIARYLGIPLGGIDIKDDYGEFVLHTERKCSYIHNFELQL